jgi:hypothetical protein
MRANLAVHMLSEAVAVEMSENAKEVTKSTQEYIKYCSSLFNIRNSETPFILDTGHRCRSLIQLKTQD